MNLPVGLTACEQVVIGNDDASGLHAILALHSTALGPALGGTRFVAYPDTGTALADALALARAMTYKNALAGLPHGGGKGVIIGDPVRDKTPDLLRAYGRLVASLGGRYVTACDVGTYVADMDVVATTNPWTTGRSPENGGSGDSGDLTAVGVHHALKAVAEHMWGEPSLTGRRFAISGVGKVGHRVAAHLLTDGARVVVADLDPAALDRILAAHPDVEVARHPDDLVEADVDVLVPCAMGGMLTAEVVERLRAAAVCGGANNQLAAPDLADRLATRGVLFAPDFVVNAGGVIAVAAEYAGRGTYDDARARERARAIGATLLEVLRTAAGDRVTPVLAAERLAEARVRAAPARDPFLPPPL